MSQFVFGRIVQILIVCAGMAFLGGESTAASTCLTCPKMGEQQNPSRIKFPLASETIRVHETLNPRVRYVTDPTVDSRPFGKSDDFMEEPLIQLVEPDHTSSPSQGLKDPNLVYYVNGMLTPADAAFHEARTLANHLGRPVGLIYNSTTGNPAQDAFQAVYDRSWPLGLADKLRLEAGQLTQMNKTTRQMTYLLVHTQRTRISIVTHSQGCLILRNALLTASQIRGPAWVERGIRWVATGVPLHDDEILIKLNRYTPLANENDPVAQILGALPVDLDDLPSTLDGHDFSTAYAPKIQNSHLW